MAKPPSIATMRKAIRMPVVRAKDGSYRVGGDTGVYSVYWSRFENRWACDCQAGSTRRLRCSHVVACYLHIAATAAKKVS